MFTKEQRSTFPYWFAHWCAFQMTALNYGVWKPHFLLHDWYKPWMKLFCEYKTVQHYHRYHANHHLEWGEKHGYTKMDLDAFLIDLECSHFTKQASGLRCVEKLHDYITKCNPLDIERHRFLGHAMDRAIYIGL